MGIYITGPAVAGVIAYSTTQSIMLPWMDGDWRAVLRIWAWAAIAATVLWAVIWLMSRRYAQAGETAAAAVFDKRQLRDILGDFCD